MTRVGPSYRQVDHWTRKGYLRAEGSGQGSTRMWSSRERDIAAMMFRLVSAGLSPELAHTIARAGGDHELVPGVRVTVTAPS